MKLYMSNRFLKEYESASLKLKDAAEGAIHDFVRLYRSEPKTFLQFRPRLATMRDVLEFDITDGDRLLAHYRDGCLIMLNMGGHEIVGRYTKNMHRYDLRKPMPAPRFFWPEHAGFFRRNPDLTTPFHYPEESTLSEWIYYLELNFR